MSALPTPMVPIDYPANRLGQPKVHEECHAPFNHNWVSEDSGDYTGGGFLLRMRCTKCGTTFKQLVSASGALLSGRKYTYQKDYKDPNKWTRADWRLNFLLKLGRRR